MHHPTDRIAHTTAFVTPVVEHWLEWEIAQWVHHEVSIWWLIAPRADALPQSYVLVHIQKIEKKKRKENLLSHEEYILCIITLINHIWQPHTRTCILIGNTIQEIRYISHINLIRLTYINFQFILFHWQKNNGLHWVLCRPLDYNVPQSGGIEQCPHL